MIPLFRKEVLENRRDRLNGEISLAVPFGWQIFGYLLLATLIISAIFMFSANYARVENVSGLIVPDKGVAVAVPTRSGVLSELLISEGEEVTQGKALARIAVSEQLASGDSAADEVARSLEKQGRRLADQNAALSIAATAQRSSLAAQIDGLQAEVSSLSEQITVQQSLVTSAQKELDQAQEVAKRGFISRRDLLVREEQLAVRTQQLAQLQAARSSKIAQVQEINRGMAQAGAQASAQQAGFQANAQEIARQQVSASQSGGYVLAAPTSGTVTAITAKAGQVVGPATPLLSIIPDGSVMRAELPMPASMIGFVRQGQSVRLAIDAFPYQQFGTVSGRIALVPGASIVQNDAKGNAASVYLVVVKIDRPYVTAFGQRQPLRPGMTLTARIVTRRQSLLEWLFEPLYAVSKR